MSKLLVHYEIPLVAHPKGRTPTILPREELYKLAVVEQLPVTAIAAAYGVSRPLIYTSLKRHGINRPLFRKPRIKA